MALKWIFAVAALAVCVHARPGGPAAYSISAPSADHESVGSTQEHTVKGHYGQSSQSDYSSQVQTAHSQSHVHRSSISNDAGHGQAYAATAPAAHAYAAPAAYAHSYAPAALDHGYATAVPDQGYILGHGAAYGHGYAAALGHSYSAPAFAYAAPALAHGYTAAKSAISYESPSYSHYSPAASYGHYAPSHNYIAVAPSLKYADAAQAYAPAIVGHASLGYAAHAPAALAHYGGPILKAAVAAPALVHTSVAGHGIHYGY